jgi:hypothetical protein
MSTHEYTCVCVRVHNVFVYSYVQGTTLLGMNNDFFKKVAILIHKGGFKGFYLKMKKIGGKKVALV